MRTALACTQALQQRAWHDACRFPRNRTRVWYAIALWCFVILLHGSRKPAAGETAITVADTGAHQALLEPRKLDFCNNRDGPALQWTLAPSRMVLVTGASQNHFLALQRFLLLARLHHPELPIVVYNLGLDTADEAALRCSGDFIVRRFPYSQYPAFFDIRVAAGEYAWKPVIVAKMLAEFEIVVWCDAGVFPTGRLDWLVQYAINNGSGFFSGKSPGRFGSWMHPGLPAHFKATLPPTPSLLFNCMANLIVFTRAAEDLARAWAACAMVKDCIAPQGSTRKNHRQDQAALTFLVNSDMLNVARGDSTSPRFRCGGDVQPPRHWFRRESTVHDHRSFYALPLPSTSLPVVCRHVSRALQAAGAPVTTIPLLEHAHESALVALIVIMALHQGPISVLVLAGDDEGEWLALGVLSALGSASKVTLVRLACDARAAPMVFESAVESLGGGGAEMRYRYGGRASLRRTCIGSVLVRSEDYGLFDYALYTASVVRPLTAEALAKLARSVVNVDSPQWGVVLEMPSGTADDGVAAAREFTMHASSVAGGHAWTNGRVACVASHSNNATHLFVVPARRGSA